MATLEKIRSKAGLLVLVVGLALFAFIIGTLVLLILGNHRNGSPRLMERL